MKLFEVYGRVIADYEKYSRSIVCSSDREVERASRSRHTRGETWGKQRSASDEEELSA